MPTVTTRPARGMSALRELEQLAGLDLRLDLGPAGLPETGSRVLSVRTVVVFPTPLGAQEAEHLAVADLERHVIEGHPVPEALAEVLDH